MSSETISLYGYRRKTRRGDSLPIRFEVVEMSMITILAKLERSTLLIPWEIPSPLSLFSKEKKLKELLESSLTFEKLPTSRKFVYICISEHFRSDSIFEQSWLRKNKQSVSEILIWPEYNFYPYGDRCKFQREWNRFV